MLATPTRRCHRRSGADGKESISHAARLGRVFAFGGIARPKIGAIQMAKTESEKACRKRWKKTAAGRASNKRYRKLKRRRQTCPYCDGRIKAESNHSVSRWGVQLRGFWRLFCTRCGRRYCATHDRINVVRIYQDGSALPVIRRRWYGYG